LRALWKIDLNIVKTTAFQHTAIEYSKVILSRPV